MQNTDHYFLYLNYLTVTDWLLVSILTLLVISLFSFKRQRTQLQEQYLSVQLLERDLRALANASIGIGSRVLKIERQQRNNSGDAIVHEQFNNPVSLSRPFDFYTSSNQPYEQAIRLAQTGVSVDDIVSVCGLSKSEVELVCMMHSLDKVS
jgi:type II secretory pathway pseudopilin PulG